MLPTRDPILSNIIYNQGRNHGIDISGGQMRALALIFFSKYISHNSMKIRTFRRFEYNIDHLNSHVKEYSVKLHGLLQNQDKASL